MALLQSFLIAFLGFIVLEFVYRKLRSGNKPWGALLIDSLLDTPRLLGLGPYAKGRDIGTALLEAAKTTGLTDFGNTELTTKLYDTTRKVAKARSSAQYSPVGHILAQRMIIKRMEIRARMIDYIKQHPKVADVKFDQPPVFVIGFPRTGTTFLHELLGLHPAVRQHYTWEQITPIPTTSSESPEELSVDRENRYKGNRVFFDFIINLAGESIQAIHRVGYDEPEECTSPCGVELPWAICELPQMVMASDEVLPLGAGEAFKFYRQFLQILAWQSPAEGSTWMLKCPFHLAYLDALHAEFPDSTVVWTHRSPVECVASSCSLYEAILNIIMNTWTIDRKALGKAVLKYTKLSLDMAQDHIKSNPTLNVVHVKYRDTIKAAKSTCEIVCKATKLPYSEQYVSKLDNYLAESDKKRKAMASKGQASGGKKGTLHAYSLEDYGLSKEMVAEEFKDYIAKYC